MSSQVATVATQVKAFAQLRHRTFQHRSSAVVGNVVVGAAEPADVATTVAKFARRYYKGTFVGDAARRVHNATLAGHLVYGMSRYGLNYEEICDAADHGVAEIVSGLSPDISLTPGPRRMGHRAKLVSARTPEPQLVVLAELHCAASKLVALDRDDVALHALLLSAWVAESDNLLGALTFVNSARHMDGVVSRVRDMILQVRRTLDSLDSGRRGRAAARAAAAVAVAAAPEE